MRSKIKVNTKLDIIEYITIVDSIVAEYFNEYGDYTPHYGRLNSMRVFYNTCVLSDIANVPHDVTDALQMKDLVADADFVAAFDEAIENYTGSAFNFTNAYNDAMSIVEAKKTSADKVVGVIKAIVTDLVNAIAETISGDNLEKFNEIAKEISKGKMSEQAIVNAFGNSEIFNKILQKE